ncbi:monovalent cation/H(+) antiporter subunit G [Bartonella sp. B30(2025)]
MKSDISLAVAIIITIFLILGSVLTLISTIGLVRFSNFYERLHMSSMSTSCGAGSILISSFLYSTFVDDRFVFHEILLMGFLFVAAPIASMLLSQAAAYQSYHLEDQSKEKSLALLSHKREEERQASEETLCEENQCDF